MNDVLRRFARGMGWVILLGCFLGLVSPFWCLAIGLFFHRLLGQVWHPKSLQWSKSLLKLGVILMGLGLPLNMALNHLVQGFWQSVILILFSFVMGLGLGRLWGVPRGVGVLVCSGTAICGGSAIAAVSTSLGSKPEDVTLSLGVVFLLNALGLLIFPWLGGLLGLGTAEFGKWAALAIHDTSSVVGAAQSFHADSLPLATATKLARTLWIAPLVLTLSLLQSNESQSPKGSWTQKIRQVWAAFPWFVGGFLVCSGLRSGLEHSQPQALIWASELVKWAKNGFGAGLFLMGASVSLSWNQFSFWKVLGMGFTLWILISSLAYALVVL
jgi:uncharacterized membrane protein YadS